MTDKHVQTIAGASFEDLKIPTIARLNIGVPVSCNSSRHFASTGKMVELGSGSVCEVENYPLSRFAQRKNVGAASRPR